ncbi:hypothetical protein BGZ94_001831, partial [Podila epigama]
MKLASSTYSESPSCTRKQQLPSYVIANNYELLARDMITQLQRTVNRLYKENRALKAVQRTNESISIKGFKRRPGKPFNKAEIRAVQHMVRFCREERAHAKAVSTANPIQRVARYFGSSERTIRLELSSTRVDKRGKYNRDLKALQNPSLKIIDSFDNTIKQYINNTNEVGASVTTKKIRANILKLYPESTIHTETIRRRSNDLGYPYAKATLARNYRNTSNICVKRRHYLMEKYADYNKGAHFIWLDESYVNQHHITDK